MNPNHAEAFDVLNERLAPLMQTRRRTARRPKGPSYVAGARVVRLREVRTPIDFDIAVGVLVTWGAFDVWAGSRAKPLLTAFDRKSLAKRVTDLGWRYIGSQEKTA